MQLPEGADGEKIGADDYLAQGHSLDDMIRLAVVQEVVDRPSLRARSSDLYCVEGGRLCWVKQSQDGESIVPLCNFDARITEEITRDNGIEVTGSFKVVGTDSTGTPLPPTEVPLSSFETMNWVVPAWGLRGILSANQAAKQKLREAVMLQSQEATRRTVYAHTGWRKIGDRRVFLTAAGALGEPDIDVEVEEDLRGYYLPEPEGDLTEALRASLELLQMGRAELEANTDGEVKVRVHGGYLAQALKACGGMVDLKLTDNHSPMLFCVNGYQLVVMPMWRPEDREQAKVDGEAKGEAEKPAEPTEQGEAEPATEPEPEKPKKARRSRAKDKEPVAVS